MFFEAAIYRSGASGDNIWHNRSTASDFIFESGQGSVTLRKRTAYPKTFAHAEGSRLTIGYGNFTLGERIAGQPLHNVTESSLYSDEFLYMTFDLSKTEVFVQRDAWSTLPIFAGYQHDRLILSSEHNRVIELMDKARLQVDRVGLLRYLCGLTPTYSTLFRNVLALHDRMRFTWKVGQEQLQFAPHATVQKAMRDRDGSIHALRPALESTIEKYRERYTSDGGVACEWSGGLDSTLLTGYLADQGYHITTASMFLPGLEGASQANKLQDFTNRFTIHKRIAIQLDPARHYWFQKAHTANAWKAADFREITALSVPQSEYLEALRADGFACLFTGIGGDELCEENENPHERVRQELSDPFSWHHQIPPVWWTSAMQSYLEAAMPLAHRYPQQTLPLVSPSVASQGFRGNIRYIEHGIWPVHPLADPRLYAYCQSLPLRYRINKHLFKMYLEARRAPHAIYRGENESFSRFYYAAATQHSGPLLERFMANSLLAEAGLISKESTLRMHRYIITLPYSSDNWRALFDIIRVLNVEITLQASGVRGL